MPLSMEYEQYLQDLAAMRAEDLRYLNSDDPHGLNISQSRYSHRIPPPQWAGPLQRQYGTHRRGPTERIL